MKAIRFFVTGGSGFLGRTVLKRLRDAGFQVDAPSSRDCNLTQEHSLSHWKKPYDFILHLAAWTQAGDFCLYHPGEQWIINQQMNTNVLSWWYQYQPQARAVFIGTSCAYDPELPLTEDNYLLGQPIKSLYSYAMTKRMMEIGVRSLADQFGLKSMTLVPSTLCGSYYHKDGRQMHFIYDIVKKILNSKNTGSPVVLWGDGTQKREILIVDDFVEAMFNLIQKKEAWGQLINVGAGYDYTIREFATAICNMCGVEPAVLKFDTTRYVGAKAKKLDINKIKSLLRWNPTNVLDAIELVIKALQTHTSKS
jgi:GDP-L-fucose synthase